MNELNVLIDRYCEAWSETNELRRKILLRKVLVEDVVYIDPRVCTRSIDELSDHIAIVLSSRPGARVLRTTEADTHHELARFSWHVALPDGTVLPEGIDFVEVSFDRAKLVRIHGFFGPLNPVKKN